MLVLLLKGADDCLAAVLMAMGLTMECCCCSCDA